METQSMLRIEGASIVDISMLHKETGDFGIEDIMLYYKAVVIKTVCNKHKIDTQAIEKKGKTIYGLTNVWSPHLG